MKRIPIIIGLLAAGMWMGGCKKEYKPVASFTYADPNAAKLKINFASIYRANPSVQIVINNNRVSNLITARTPFPGGGYNTGGDNRPDYLNLTPGVQDVTVAIPAFKTNVDSIRLFNGSVTLQSGKNYSLHITDTAANTKYLLVEDDISVANAGTSKYRFVNLIPNVAAIDLYYGPTLMASNVPYLKATDVFTMFTPSVSLDWSIREAGAAPTSTPLAIYNSTNTTLSTRNYTAFAMGYKGLTSPDVRRPFLSFFHTR